MNENRSNQTAATTRGAVFRGALIERRVVEHVIGRRVLLEVCRVVRLHVAGRILAKIHFIVMDLNQTSKTALLALVPHTFTACFAGDASLFGAGDGAEGNSAFRGMDHDPGRRNLAHGAAALLRIASCGTAT